MKPYWKSSILAFLLCFNLLYSWQILQQNELKLHEEVHVIVKLTEVFVMDKKGEPVKDLSSSDFTILKDGRIEPIAYFERKGIAFNIEENAEITEEKDAMDIEGRKFFFIFDFGHNTPKSVELSKKTSLYLLSQLQLIDRISIISYSQSKGLTMHEYLTNDHEKIRKIIEGFGKKEIVGRAEIMDKYLEELWEEEIPLGPCIQKAGRTGQIPPFEKANARAQLLHFCSLLKKLALSLRYIQGYKHVILFSVGPYQDIIYGQGFSNIDLGFVPIRYSREFYGDFSIIQEYESMAKEFASSNCLIYSVNTEGLPEGKALSLGIAQKGEHSLVRLSQITGGKYYPNSEDLRPAVEDIAKRTSFYYVLGIPVKEEMDGKFHKIEVKVKRKGVKVHAPLGYYNPKPFKEYSDFEKFLHLVDSAFSEKPLFGEVKEFPINLNPLEREKRTYEIFFEIPKDDFQGEGEIVLIFFNSAKEIIKIRRERFHLKSEADRLLYKRVIEFPSNTSELRVVIRNISTGRTMRGIGKVEEK